MRIAIATDWFAPRTGGIETQLVELARRLALAGHTVDVLTSTPGLSTGEGYHVRRLDVFRLPFAGIAASPRLFPALARELRRGYDVVHCHASVVSPLAYAAAALACSGAQATVLTFHSVLRHKRHLLRAAGAIAALHESRVEWSAVSTSVADQASHAIGAPVTVLANGTDLAFWHRMSRPASTSPHPVLVTAGRLHRKKRPVALVRAFSAACRRARVPARLIIAGDGPERSRVARAASIARAEGASVELLGWCDRDALRALYAGSDAFVLGSAREAFGIAALEARAAGLPVIAMATAGCRDFLDHGVNALLCRDDADLEAQLTAILTDAPLRARLAAGASSLARYDWSAVITEHERVYRRAIERATDARAVAPTA